MKNKYKFIVFIVLLTFFASFFYILAAPTSNIFRTILPETNNTYDLGSNALRWANGYFTNLDTSTITINSSSAGDITIKKADPTLIYNVITAGDTDFWAGVQDNAAGTDNDLYQIGKGIVPGTTPFFTINASGSVGIGTQGPLTLLDIEVATVGDIITLGHGHVDSSVRGTLGYSDISSTSFWIANRYNDNNSTFGIRMKGSAAGNEVLTVLGNGNVGVGTKGPGGLLHVAQNDGSGDAVRASVILSRYWASTSDTRGAALFSYFPTGGSDQLVFGVSGTGGSTTNPASYTNAKMVIQANGLVGIGTTSPTAVLHLKAGTTAASTAPLKFTSGSLLTTAEAGAVEFLTDAWYGTITTGAARKTFAFLESPIFTGTVTAPTIVSTTIIRLKNYTVATLPAGTQGDTAFVTDATTPTYLGALVGGGAVVTPVFYNGTAWVSY